MKRALTPRPRWPPNGAFVVLPSDPEPNTYFYRHPPSLPEEDAAAMQDAIGE
jgi:hypothetical protein